MENKINFNYNGKPLSPKEKILIILFVLIIFLCYYWDSVIYFAKWLELYPYTFKAGKYDAKQWEETYFYHNMNDGKDLPDVSNYRTDTPEEIINTIPLDIKNGISQSPVFFIDQFVDYLVSWTDNDYLKIKSIHDWIHIHISYSMKYKGVTDNNAYKILMTKKGVCRDFSTLFQLMAEKAGFEAYNVYGLSKQNKRFAYHSWNVVKINDIYYLIDTVFDSSYSTKYFLSDSALFLKDHYPDDTKFLLVDSYVDRDEFVSGKNDEIMAKWFWQILLKKNIFYCASSLIILI